MDPRALALPADMIAGEALERVRRADEVMIADPFVIERNQCLLGYVELADLLRANNTTTLGRQVRQCLHLLPAQSRLADLVAHKGRHGASTLPVVERGGQLVARSRMPLYCARSRWNRSRPNRWYPVTQSRILPGPTGAVCLV